MHRSPQHPSTMHPTLLKKSMLSLQFTSLLLLFLIILANHTYAEWTYDGCFTDNTDVFHRSLPYAQFIETDMTVQMCMQKCSDLGFNYAGAEYRMECYCGRELPAPELRVADMQCAVDCGGKDPENRKCGGVLSLSIYHTPIALPEPTFDTERPLVCLVMILKNEAHTILNTLRTVKDVVDCWYILDTGSEDGTQDIIEEYMAKEPALPGKLFEEPFVDYGATRNRILVLAKENVNPIFTLMLSADEELMNPQELRSFLQDMRYARGPQHGAYPVVMNTGIKFDSVRIARVDGGWRYRARVHEYLAPPSGPYIGIFRSKTDINVKFNATDGPRRFKSQWFIKKILEEDLEKDPNDTRSIYYLARTNSGIDNHTAAFYYYDLLAKRSHWEEEVYHGMVMKALESKQIPSISWKERQTMLLDAYLYKPNSMDALHALAQDHFDSGRHLLAYLFALRAVQIPIPPGLSVVENVLLRPQKFLYDYEGHRLLGFAAREIGEWEQCIRSFNHVLNYNPDDTIVRDRIQVCEQRFKAAGGRLLARPPLFEAPPPPKSEPTEVSQQEQNQGVAPVPPTRYGNTDQSSFHFFSFTTLIVFVFLLAILAFALKKYVPCISLKKYALFKKLKI